MRDHIKFSLIKSMEELEALQRFAKTFNHQVGLDSIMPIYTIERGEQVIGYFNVLMYPVVCPALHPEHCTPRDFYETLRDARQHYCFVSIDAKFPNGTCFMAIPKQLSFPGDALEKLGFKFTGKELWQCIPL